MRKLIVELVTIDLAPVRTWELDLDEIPGVEVPTHFYADQPRFALRARLQLTQSLLPAVPLDLAAP